MATVPLSKPIALLGKEVHALEIEEELQAGFLMSSDRAKGDVGKSFELLSAACRVPVAKLKKMSIVDFNKAQTVLQSVMDGTYGKTEEEVEEKKEKEGKGEYDPDSVPQTGGI